MRDLSPVACMTIWSGVACNVTVIWICCVFFGGACVGAAKTKPEGGWEKTPQSIWLCGATGWEAGGEKASRAIGLRPAIPDRLARLRLWTANIWPSRAFRALRVYPSHTHQR
jgi:hypothetical protein